MLFFFFLNSCHYYQNILSVYLLIFCPYTVVCELHKDGPQLAMPRSVLRMLLDAEAGLGQCCGKDGRLKRGLLLRHGLQTLLTTSPSDSLSLFPGFLASVSLLSPADFGLTGSRLHGTSPYMPYSSAKAVLLGLTQSQAPQGFWVREAQGEDRQDPRHIRVAALGPQTNHSLRRPGLPALALAYWGELSNKCRGHVKKKKSEGWVCSGSRMEWI